MLHSALAVTTAPAAEPVTVEFARKHCRIDHASDDDLLKAYIATARQLAESYLGRALIEQTLTWTIQPKRDAWPKRRSFLSGIIELPRAPVIELVSATVLDIFGNSTVLSTEGGQYVLDAALEPARLWLNPEAVLGGGQELRVTPLQHFQAVFQAGYGSAWTAVPNLIRTAILMTVAWLYEHRGDTADEMPAAARRLLDPFRIAFFGGGIDGRQ